MQFLWSTVSTLEAWLSLETVIISINESVRVFMAGKHEPDINIRISGSINIRIYQYSNVNVRFYLTRILTDFNGLRQLFPKYFVPLQL